jgi:hypothetical protein
MTPSRRFRVLLSASMAVWATLCVTENASAATGRARAGEMAQNCCCCAPKPASGCCCETKAPLSLDRPTPVAVDGAPGMAGERVETARGGSCQCGPGEPVAPGSGPRSANAKRETDSRSPLPDSVFTAPERSCPAFRQSASSRGSPPNAPLYLQYSHLII